MENYSMAFPLFNKALDFLRTLGFEGPVTRAETSKLLGDSVSMTFSSRLGRTVMLSYSSPQKGRPGSIAALIISHDGQRFSVDDWLAANEMTGAIHFSPTPGLSEEGFIEQFCTAFELLAHGRLQETLLGRTWKNVPFAWKGYR